jgi:hypothetical protein
MTHEEFLNELARLVGERLDAGADAEQVAADLRMQADLVEEGSED